MYPASGPTSPKRKLPFEFLFKNQVLLFLAALVIGISVQFVVMKRFGFSNQIALFDALVSGMLISVLVIILKHIQNNYHSRHPITLVNIAILQVFSFVLVVALIRTAHFYYAEDEVYFDFLTKNGIARGAITFLVLLLALYQFWLSKNQIMQRKVMEQKLEIERQLNQAELANIEQQLQPHFLFNSLNSISALTITQPEEARRMVQLLSDFLRGTLRKDQEEEVDLKVELQHINLYLEIEKVRFGHRLKTDIQLDDLCENAKIPALILQPIVENCIKYGLYGHTGSLVIRIEASCKNNFLLLTISNPYDKESVHITQGTGFGLKSIGRKLLLMYGQNDLIQTQTTADTFIVRLKIPQREIQGL